MVPRGTYIRAGSVLVSPLGPGTLLDRVDRYGTSTYVRKKFPFMKIALHFFIGFFFVIFISPVEV